MKKDEIRDGLRDKIQDIIKDEIQEGINDYIDSGNAEGFGKDDNCLLYTSPSPRDRTRSRMPSSA